MSDETYESIQNRRAFWNAEETETDEAIPEHVLDWLMDMDIPEEVYELLDAMAQAVNDSRKSTIYVALANYLDRHKDEINEYVK